MPESLQSGVLFGMKRPWAPMDVVYLSLQTSVFLPVAVFVRPVLLSVKYQRAHPLLEAIHLLLNLTKDGPVFPGLDKFPPKATACSAIFGGKPGPVRLPMVAQTEPTGVIPVVMRKCSIYSVIGFSSPPPDVTTDAPYFPSKAKQWTTP